VLAGGGKGGGDKNAQMQQLAQMLQGGGGFPPGMGLPPGSRGNHVAPSAARPPPPRQLTRDFSEALRLQVRIGACLPARPASRAGSTSRAAREDSSPHDPQQTMLHRVVREHLETFLGRRAEEGEPMPSFVVDELRGYLRCGVLAHGAVRFACGHCGQDRLVGLSCKGRGFCPRCMGRRMTEMARHWVSAVLPRVRVRQWVLSLPFELRVPLAYRHELTLAVHGVAARVIEAWYRDKGRRLGILDPRTGSITAVQRFGSDLALNVHFHMLFVDGVYDVLGAFTPIAAPTRDELETLCTTIAERVQRLLERRALDHDHADERACAWPSLAPPHAAAQTSTLPRALTPTTTASPAGAGAAPATEGTV
jgi:hypothetical protein